MTVQLLTLPGVFAPISDSWMLAEAVEREGLGPGHRALDLCTGSGVVALAAAAGGAEVTAVDVSRRALACARLNARRHGRRVRAVRSRLFDRLADQRFDLIASNPPYVPSPRAEVPVRGASRAWEAGFDGRLVLDELCAEVPRHLRPGGVVLLTHSSLIGEDRTVELLRAGGLRDIEVVDRRRGPLGPLMVAQRDQGRIPADVDEEDVIVLRAVAPPG